jgi:protein-S-isoprenylcysteine O-methyltransferase Ste14
MIEMSVPQEPPQPRARRGGTWLQRWRVPLGFLCAVVFLLFARPRPSTLLVGAIVSTLGLLLRGWAAGHIRKNSALATSGPYAFTRNPLYLGSFLLGLGFTIGSGFWPLGILFAVLFLGIYFPVMRVESATLAKLFGRSFQEYAREVPLFFPRVTPYRSGPANGFDGSLYVRYREYRAALGLVIAWALLVFKAYYFQ